MGKIVLFYKYLTLERPGQIRKWQDELARSLNLTGRIIISTEGINATLGGEADEIDTYVRTLQTDPKWADFADIDFKYSEGDARCFPRLYCQEKREICHLGVDPEELTAADGGTHLTPKEVHELLTENPDDLVILDTRNDYEYAIGKFENAILPPIKNFRDFPAYIEENLDLFKDKRVLMYCTGGVRCERATAVLAVKKVAKEVYQILGGIHRYVEEYPNGFFRGSNYVFDKRVAVKINDDVLGSCRLCAQPCEQYTNCMNAECNMHYIGCNACLDTYENTCSTDCQQLVNDGKVYIRHKFVAHGAEKPSQCSIQ